MCGHQSASLKGVLTLGSVQNSKFCCLECCVLCKKSASLYKLMPLPVATICIISACKLLHQETWHHPDLKADICICSWLLSNAKDQTHLPGNPQPDIYARSASVLMTAASNPEHRGTPRSSGVCFCLPALHVIIALSVSSPFMKLHCCCSDLQHCQ